MENRTQTNSRHAIVNMFIEGLARLESDGQSGDLLKLFAGNCTLGNVLLDTKLSGRDGAERFWTDYRRTFGEIRSEFERITETENVAVLEWVSKGTLRTGETVSYRGASVLVISDNLIVDFMAYFDGRHLTAHLHSHI